MAESQKKLLQAWTCKICWKKKNERFTEINKKQIAERGEQLEQAGKYRTLLNRGKFARGWQPTWSDTVRTVGSVDFDKVIDTAGQESLTIFALPIESATEVGPARRIERGGNAEVDRRQRTLLGPFVDTLYGQNQGKKNDISTDFYIVK